MEGNFSGRGICLSKKRGLLTHADGKRGFGSRVLAIVDAQGIPLAIQLRPAGIQEYSGVEPLLKSSGILANSRRKPENLLLIADRNFAYQFLAKTLLEKYQITLITPERARWPTHPWQDGRRLRRTKRRWKVERFFSWLHKFRRLICRWEYYAENFLAFLYLACCIILMRRYF